MPEWIIISYEYFTKLISETHRETMILFIMTPDDVDYNHSMRYTWLKVKQRVFRLYDTLGINYISKLNNQQDEDYCLISMTWGQTKSFQALRYIWFHTQQEERNNGISMT